MSRTLGVNLLANAEAAYSTERTLCKVVVNGSTTLYLADGGDNTGADIVWDGQTWVKTHFSVEGLTWQEAGIPNQFQVSFNTNDKTLLVDLVQADKDSTVTVYQTAALSSYAGADDVVKVADGVLGGGFTLTERGCVFVCLPLVKIFPPYFVNAANGFSQITGPGTYQMPGGTVTIERER